MWPVLLMSSLTAINSVEGTRLLSLAAGLFCVPLAFGIARRLDPEAASLTTAQFFFLPILLPFFFLLSRNVKRRRIGLAMGASYVLFMYLVDFYWLILPNYKAEGHLESQFAIMWTDIMALIGMGGAFFAVFAYLDNMLAWLTMRDEAGLDGNETGAAVAWAMNVLIDDIRRRQRAAGASRKERK